MQLYNVFTGTASATEISFDIPLLFSKQFPYSLDIFNLGNYDLIVTLIDNTGEMQDAFIVPKLTFKAYDNDKIAEQRIGIQTIKVKCADVNNTTEFQIVIWYRR